MRKRRESSADRIWKEKLDLCATPPEAIVMLVLMAFLVAGAFAVS